MTISIGAFEAKVKFSELLEKAAAGETIFITKHDRLKAKLVPAEDICDEDGLEKIIEAMERFQKENVLNKPGQDNLTLRQMIDEGRK
ncbi:MAG: type II toxin-antitoxin system Phd/YefM family antitoxin [Elusimicrobiota bacterium]